jgi:hypothetical protein
MGDLDAFLAYAADSAGSRSTILHQTVMHDLTVGGVRAAAEAIRELPAGLEPQRKTSSPSGPKTSVSPENDGRTQPEQTAQALPKDEAERHV